jgi:hypothetical protein
VTAGARGGCSGDGATRTAGARTRPEGAAAALARRLSAARARRSGRGARGEARSSGAWSAGCRDAAPSRQHFNPRGRRGARRLTSGTRLSAIFEFKNYPE